MPRTALMVSGCVNNDKWRSSRCFPKSSNHPAAETSALCGGFDVLGLSLSSFAPLSSLVIIPEIPIENWDSVPFFGGSFVFDRDVVSLTLATCCLA